MFSICPFYYYLTCEHDILQIGPSNPQSNGMKQSTRGQQVKGQGHTRPNLYLEVWQSYHS